MDLEGQCVSKVCSNLVIVRERSVYKALLLIVTMLRPGSSPIFNSHRKKWQPTRAHLLYTMETTASSSSPTSMQLFSPQYQGTQNRHSAKDLYAGTASLKFAMSSPDSLTSRHINLMALHLPSRFPFLDRMPIIRQIPTQTHRKQLFEERLPGSCHDLGRSHSSIAPCVGAQTQLTQIF